MKRKVCIVCDGYWDQLQGGAEYQLHLLAHCLARRGYDIHYLYVARGTPVASSEITLWPMRLKPWIKWLFYPYHALFRRQLFRKLDEIRPDVLLNRVGNAFTGHCASYGRRRGVPMIWHIANITDLQPAPLKLSRTLAMAWLDRKLLRRGIEQASYVIAQARYQDELLRERFGRSADLVVPNFHPAPAHLPAKADPPLVVWVANVKPVKQPEMFIRMAKALSGRVPARFVMVGRSEHGRYSAGIRAELEAAGNVEWRGELPIEETNALLGEASVFVNTSLYEGFPNTFVQAWLRRTVVVSLHFDPDGMLEKQELGSLSGHFAQLCEDVASLLENDAARRTLADRAQTFARDSLTPEVNVARIAELIERAAPP